jgi:DNA-binding NtrC family response regulator
MAVVLLSGDLMGASRIEGAARLAGIPYRMVGTVDAVLAACAATPVSIVAVDLATAGIEVAALVNGLKQQAARVPTVIAYGPHVHEAVLEAAQAAGCDQVLSRGQFMSQVDAIFARFAGSKD